MKREEILRHQFENGDISLTEYFSGLFHERYYPRSVTDKAVKTIYTFGVQYGEKHPSEETIRKVIDIYKQWYSEQCDQPLYDYVIERWNDNGNETPYSLDCIMGDVQRDLDDFIDGFMNTKNKQL